MEPNKPHEHGCCATDKSKSTTKTINNIANAEISNFVVSGMDCADEIAAIQNSLTHPKIGKVSANLMTSQVNVEHEPSLTRDEITRLINKSGEKDQTSAAPLSY